MRMAHVLLGILFGASTLAAQSFGQWTAAGQLTVARSGHSVTRLADGRLLIAGGAYSSGVVGQAEIYDPATGLSTSLASSLATPRKNHAAVLLQDGRALLVGGEGPTGGALDSAEIFNPSTQSFAPAAGRMAQIRRGHTATLLADGSVLIAGGDNGVATLASLERFNPASGLFEPLAAVLPTPREQHTATLLLDGRVLIAGGRSGATALASTDYFDPKAGTLTAGPALLEARYAHSATRLLYGLVAVVGGTDGSTIRDTAEVIYPVSMPDGSVSGVAANRLQVGRYGHVALPLPENENLLVLGGRSANGPVASVELLDVVSYQFGLMGSLSAARAEFGASAGAGRACAVGGKGAGDLFLGSVEAYDYATLTTDQTDYPPNSTVTFRGSGWQPGESVQIQIRKSNGEPDTNLSAVADGQGRIQNSAFATKTSDAGVVFSVTASGSGSQRAAYATFYDSHFISSLTPSSFTQANSNVLLTISGGNFTTNSATGHQVFISGPTIGTITLPINSITNTAITATIPLSVGNIPGAYSVFVRLRQTFFFTCCFRCCSRCGFFSTCCSTCCFTCSNTVTHDSNSLALTITPCIAPSVTLQPSNQTVPLGGNATFTAAASGTTPLAVQWQVSTDGGLSWSIIPGATSTTLTVASVGLAQNGNKYRAVFTNSCGSATSSAATLTVADTTPPTVACPAPTTASADATGMAAIPNVLPGVVASDNVTPPSSLIITQSPAPGTLVGVGTTTITVTVTDQAGNSSACSTSFTVVVPDLVVSKTASSLSITNGSNLTYTMTVANIGTGAASNVLLTDSLPSGTTFVSASAGCLAGGATVTCNLGTLSPGAPASTVTVVVSVSAPVGATLGNTASATTTTPEINTANNSAAASVTVINSPPSVTSNNAPVTVNEGSLAVNTGTSSDPDPGDSVTLTASVGSVTPSGAGWSWSLATTDGPAQSQTVTITATDNHGASSTTAFSLVVNNVAPVLTSLTLSANPIPENGTVTVSGTFTDPGVLDTHTALINWGDGSPNTTVTLAAGVLGFPAVPHQYLDDNPTGTPLDTYNITVTVTDKDSDTGGGGTAIIVNNVPPVVGAVTGPTSPLAVTAALATVSANFTDVGPQDTHTCTVSWDDGTTSAGTVTETGGSGACTGTHTYTATGVYTVTITVTDDDTGAASSAFQFVVVFDPNDGFVTGGGWINSPAGAYVADPSLTGKASFGFVSKYLPGRTIPSGSTEFQFRVANFNFKSTVYEWLVVSGAKAQFKGSGTVNGAGDYMFLLTATDGELPGGGGLDKFRIKIVNKSTGLVVYDNVMGASDDLDSANPQAIAQGSIVIHK